MKNVLFAITVLFSFNALADDAPPPEFMALKVGWYQGAETGTTCTVGQFTGKGIQANFTKRWKKIANNDYWFVASDSKAKLEIRFTKVKGLGFIQEVGVNNDRIPQINFTELMLPVISTALKK